LAPVISSAETLVQQCMDGDKNAYRLLYERYSKAMYNTALRIVNQVPDAEDVLQEAFTDAFGQIHQFQQRSSFGTWLKQIVIYKSITLLKKRKVKWVEMEVADEKATDEYEDDNTGYTVELVRKAIKELPDGYRTVLTLYLVEGYDQEEIAEILGLAHSTVRTQYIRGKDKLLQLLKKKEVYERGS